MLNNCIIEKKGMSVRLANHLVYLYNSVSHFPLDIFGVFKHNIIGRVPQSQYNNICKNIYML